MKVQLILGRTICDYATAWMDAKIVGVEIPLNKQDPDGIGKYQVIGCQWESEKEGNDEIQEETSSG